MTDWTTSLNNSVSWTGASSSPTTGVPYNSDYTYNSVLTYNATEIDYEPVWLDSSRNTVDWTTL